MLLLPVIINAQTPASKSINISKLTAYEKENRLYVEWSANTGTNNNYWQVQSSSDGKRFSTIAIVLGPDPNWPTEHFTFKEKITDKSLSNYYKVVHVSADNQLSESEITSPANQLLSPDSQRRTREVQAD